MDRVFSAPSGIGGSLIPPADKSITHRALLLAAVSQGSCHIRNPLDTGDCRTTRDCLSALGVQIRVRVGRPHSLIIQGRGLGGFQEPKNLLDAGNSGTTMRLLTGLLAGLPLYAVLSGDPSLRSRPMLRVVEPLREMGARIAGRSGGEYAPLSFLPGKGSLNPLDYTLKVPSAQVKSALLLAALRATGRTVLRGRLDSRDHTERFFQYLKLPLKGVEGTLVLEPVSSIPAFDLEVPGDPSSAAFYIAAAAISQRELTVKRCGLNPTRLGFVEVLRRMGCRIELEQEGACGEEPVGRLRIFPGQLQGVSIGGGEVPSLIDEIPLIAALAVSARGITTVRGARELRHKESDRIQAIAQLISALGGRVEVQEDGFTIEGPQQLKAGTADAGGDHRMAMTGAVLSAGVRGAVRVRGFEAASISFPDFTTGFQLLGGKVE